MASPAGNRVNALTLSFTLVSGIAVFFRIFTRLAIIRNAGFEDVCIVLAMAFSVGLAVTIGVQVQHGLGRHIVELSPRQQVDSLKAFWASIWLYYLALAFTKMSILVQYFRIFPTRRFRIVCAVVMGVVVLYGLWGLFGTIFLCFPVQFFWDKTVPNGKCLNQFAVWFSNASMNILQDVVILFLPLPVIRRLNIPKRPKRALMMVFALGGIVCVISMVRLHTLLSISNSKDPTFDNPPAASLSAIETNVAIITACLPALRPLLSRMMPNYFPRESTSRYFDAGGIEEGPPKHMRSMSASTRPQTASTTKKGHSRNGSGATHSTSGGSELGDLSRHQATVAGTGTRVNGPVREVHIRSASRESHHHPLPAPRLPRLPENIATIGSVDSGAPPVNASHNRSVSSLHSSRAGSRTPRTPIVQKPLPITPFPVTAR